MRSILRRIGALLGQTLEMVMGILGGVVCAFAACLVAVHLYTVTRCHPLILLAVSVFIFVGFGVGGLLKHRFFRWFSEPLFSMFAGDGLISTSEGDLRFADVICLLIGLPSLLIGALFQIHLMVALGVLLFVVHAARLPSAGSTENAEPGASPNSRPPPPSLSSPAVRSSESLRTPSSGGCG